VNLLDRRADLMVTQIDVLRDAVRRVRARAPFRIDAWGRPSRSYALPVDFGLWTLPQGDADFPGEWRAIKTAFVIFRRQTAESGTARVPWRKTGGHASTSK
jgi:putative transposase